MRRLRLVVIACAALILSSCNTNPNYIQAPFNGSAAEIEVSTLAPQQPRFYSLYIENKKISFFLVKINGDIQAYFNACRECYPKKLGYRFDNGALQCKTCNVRYSLEGLREGIGNCCPVCLKGVLHKNTYVITRAALLEGTKFF
jgi:uncharacterized membrane protein